jgi:NhaP-type Na+/H+ or K+/H+ antiporter
MGALVGGMYATGKSPAEINAIVDSLDWDVTIIAENSSLGVAVSSVRFRYLGCYAAGLYEVGRCMVIRCYQAFPTMSRSRLSEKPRSAPYSWAAASVIAGIAGGGSASAVFSKNSFSKSSDCAPRLTVL